MASKDVYVRLNDKELKLSNLDKILFEDPTFIKAEIVDYYLKIAPRILPFLKNRPLTLIRFPEGISGTKFYSKNRPEWTPAWISSSSLPEKPEITYLEVNDEAALVYVANLAALELHAMTLQHLNYKPDQMIFDLDPPEGANFEELKFLAKKLRDFLIERGYNPYIKTSGSKGLHIYLPIIPDLNHEIIVQKAKDLAREFVVSNPETTVEINKEKRTHKTLIDIYRNHRAQTCAAPYAIRALAGAPVSTPISWHELENLASSRQFNIKSVLMRAEDPWQHFFETATKLDSKSTGAFVVPDLSIYEAKRDFEITTEPKAEPVVPSDIPRYVIQKHQASNLHYDLRLEDAGLLLSWAIPKAIPSKPGIKRLAIQTEPHPLKYLDFEGVIPKEEYGGGEMWVFDCGEVHYLKKEEKKIHFKLNGEIKGEFLIYQIEAGQWLLERKSEEWTFPSLKTTVMLAELTQQIPKENYSFEIKWDGIRVLIFKNNQDIKIMSRNGREITETFPEIVAAVEEIDAQTALIDAELVVLDRKGIPEFARIISRMHTIGKLGIETAMKTNPTVAYAFDIIHLDGKDLTNTPLYKRRKWLSLSLKEHTALRFSRTFEDGEALFNAISAQNMEGIIAKKTDSLYHSGSRSADWLKIKVKNQDEALIIGYIKGKGDRSGLLGSLILARMNENEFQYMGKVGTGFSQTKLAEIYAKLRVLDQIKKPIKDIIDEESQAVWVAPIYSCKLSYASLTTNHTYREPVFIELFETLD